MARLRQLESSLLPATSPNGSYTSTQYDFVRAYLVLAHAEVESYLEDMTSDVLDSATSRWDVKQVAGRCIAALLLYDDKRPSPPESLARQPADMTFSELIGKAVKKHRKYVTQDNHGVKEKNILRLLLPVGMLEPDLDSVWLGMMNSFGVQRGTVAHNSARRVKTPPDPSAAKKTVADVSAGLLALDSALVTLRRK